MTLAAVTFDLDGTLFDHATAALSGLRSWVTSSGWVHDPDLERAWTDAEDRHFRDWRDGRISFAEQRRRRLRDVLPLVGHPVGDDAALDALFSGYLAAYRRAWRPFDDVAECLAAVADAGLPTAVLTNGTVEQQNAKIDAMGLTGRLGPVLTSEELGAAKPDPAAFHSACDRLGVPARSTLHVGDDHEADLLGARTAGLQAVLVDRAGRHPDEPHRITILRELGALLP